MRIWAYRGVGFFTRFPLPNSSFLFSAPPIWATAPLFSPCSTESSSSSRPMRIAPSSSRPSISAAALSLLFELISFHGLVWSELVASSTSSSPSCPC
ncbi:hypothetical protein CLOM_g14918 [Closterium sp. NIES-68]|nr:hypothetical protein CLOM_g14918 [Closterium sp. NIES-68]GJP80302.1 hypothetical protein CLOP_g10529 [Closterium sp. NIES-67]